MAAGFDEKKKSFCFVVVKFELIFCHPCFDVICASTEFFGEVVYFTDRDFLSCVSSGKKLWFTEWLPVMSERGVVYRTKRTGPSTEP